MRLPLPIKQLQIEQANKVVFVVIAIASAITVFSLVSSKALLSQAAHHKRVLDAQHQAIKQLETNLSAANTLSTQFNAFNSGTTNLIGGANTNNANGPKDGDNARIVLDALPSQYDFPALISSLDKMLRDASVSNRAISGSDQSASTESDPQAKPTPVVMSFAVGGNHNYSGVQNTIKDFERSIRLFDITQLQLNGSEQVMLFSMAINTYFQPGKSLNITTKEIK